MEATLTAAHRKSWPRYSNYHAVDSYWLREIPSHWEFKRLKWTINACQNGIWGDEPTGLDEDIGCVRVADFDRDNLVVTDKVELTQRSLPQSKREGRVLRRGDLLLEKSGGGDLQPVGALVLFDSGATAVCSNFVARVSVAQGNSPSYLRYLHAALYAARVNTRSMKQSTGIQNLDSDQYFNEYVGVPPLPEQRALAAFLDRETARIDALIERKQRLIDLLEEKRQAVISHAVTKGLAPDVKLQDSGIDWIGRLPQHWTVRPVASFCRVVRGGSPRPAGDPEFFNGTDTPWITVAETTKDSEKYLTGTKEFLTAEGRKRSRYIESDTFILTNSGATLGVPKILRIAGCINDGSVAFLNIDSHMSKDFLYYYFTSQTEDIRVRMNQGMGQPNLNTDIVSRMPVPCPPFHEQTQIVAFLDDASQIAKKQANAIRNSIELTNEYRTALISAAVTGQIDVREEVRIDG